MQTKKPESEMEDAQRRLQEERQKLVVQKVKLPNGATFTRFRPVVST
jgi:hypothetical protein